ncbi:MAG: hypothetical protein ACON44_04745 [Candidatus Puniceispirillaceae bacterium]
MEGDAAYVERVMCDIKQLVPSDKRTLIAIGGPPASGKSTLAAELHRLLNANNRPCGLIPMDGFHLDNNILQDRGLLSRKGAPETFDVVGFAKLIGALNSEKDISVPLFDRDRDCVVRDASNITANQKHIIIEGNYLFLNDGLWRDLHSYWTLSVFIAPPIKELEARLIRRWVDQGLDKEAAETRAKTNDIPNANLILSQSNMHLIDVLLD